jgi:N-acetylmuramic acid 6-phosphate etherase
MLADVSFFLLAFFFKISKCMFILKVLVLILKEEDVFMQQKYLIILFLGFGCQLSCSAQKMSENVNVLNDANLRVTERVNVNTKDIDLLPAAEVARLMNLEDQKIAQAITPYVPEIARAAQVIADQLKEGGRLIYFGAGTSGRLGVLDASECLPTFSAEPGQVVGIIAGGDLALRKSIEGAEDSASNGIQDLKNVQVCKEDVVCGISASGAAAYVTAGLKYAKELGCFTICLTCNPKNQDKNIVDCFISPEVGPEVIAGSTRLKAGTATKMVLNMITTTAFILYGKVFRNLMVDLKPYNKKLVERAKRILRSLFDIDDKAALDLFEKSGRNVKTAILMRTCNVDCDKAVALLKQGNGYLRKAIELAGK